MADMTIRVRVIGESQQYRADQAANAAATKAAAASVTQSARQTAAASASVTRASGIAGKALLLGIGAGLAISAKAAIDFESSFAGIRKTVNASEAQFAMLADTMRALAKEIPVNVNELNRIGELGGQFGLGVDAIEGFTDTVAKLGVTTNLSAETAAIALSRLASILDVPTSKFGNMGSSIVELGNNLETTEDEITTFALRIAPVGAIVNLTAAQVLGLAAAFSSVGVPAERGGTAVQKVFVAMQDAVVSGGEKLESFARAAGMSAEEFADAFEKDAARAFEAFVTGLARIDEAGGNVFAVLRDVGLANERSVQALLAVGSAGDKLTRALGLSESAWERNIALNDEAQKRFDTTASKIQLALNHIYDLRIEIGQNLLPVIGNWASGLADLIDWIESWDDTTKTIVSRLLLLTAGLLAAGKGVKIFSRLIGVDLVRNMVRAASATFVLTERSAALVAGLSRIGLAGALFLAIDAITDWIGKQVHAKQVTDDLTEALKQEREGIEGVVDATIKQQLFGDAPLAIIQAFNEAGISIDEFVAKIRKGEDATADLAEVTEAYTSHLTDTKLGPFDLSFGDDQKRQFFDFIREMQVVSRGLADAQVADLADRQNALIGMTEIERRAADEMIRLGGAAQASGDEIGQSQEEIDEYAEAVSKAESAIKELADAQLASRDAGFAFIDAAREFAAAQEEYNKVGGDTLDNSLALQEAWTGLMGAARALGTTGLQGLIDNLNEMHQAGAITTPQMMQMLAVIAAMGPIASAASSTAATSLAGFAQSANVSMSNIRGGAIGVIQSMFGMVSAVGGGIQSLNLLARAYAAMRFSRNPADFAFMTAQLASQAQALFGNLGGALARALGSGYSSTASGGGGAAGAVESDIERAARIAREGISAISSAISAGIDVQQATRSLREAEEDLADLRLEQLNLPSQIAAKELELAQARADAEAVTLEEQKAIEDALEAWKRAQKAYAQGVITATDLALAEQDYTDAVAASTAMSDEVTQLEEELAELEARRTELVDEITQAEEDLIGAQLRLIEAQLGLIDAGQVLAGVTAEQMAQFIALAAAAGLAESEIRALMDTYAALAAGAFGSAPIPTAPGATGSTSTGGSSGSTATGTTTTTPPLPPLTSGGVTTGGTSGGARAFHSSGIVPGVPGREVMVRALAGEVIYNPRDASGLRGMDFGPAISIGQMIVYVQGVLDLTNPNHVNRMMDTIETQLRIRPKGKR